MNKRKSKISLAGIEADAQNHLTSITGKKEAIEKESSFPLHCFPPMLQKMVLDLHDGFGYPIDFTAFSMMCVVATCIGNSLRIAKKVGWTESPILFCALIGRPGTCKTHPLNFALKPLEEIDKLNHDQFRKEQEEYERQLLIAKAKGKDGVEERMDLSAPVLKQMIVSDVTMEALCKVLTENPKGVCLKMDELVAWVKNMTRYVNGSEEQMWMSIWSNTPIRLNRKFDKCSDYITSPFVCVVGTMQPEVLKELASDCRRQNGFMDRIMFVMPENVKSNRWIDNNGSTDLLLDQWRDFVKKLLERSDKRFAMGESTIGLSPEANKCLNDWQARNAELKDSMKSDIASAYSKLEVYAIRLSLIFHEMSAICSSIDHKVVEIESVRSALEVVEYLRKGIARMNNTLDLSFLTEKELELFETLPETFRKMDGDQIAKSICSWEPRQLTRFLDRYNGSLFSKVKHGEYRKLSFN